MKDTLKEYLDAEISVMLDELGPQVKPGSTRFNLKALKWIEQNAAQFRMKWDNKNGSIVADTNRTGKIAK